MEHRDIDYIINKAVEKIKEKKSQTFEVEASGRHIHLSKEHLEALCGNEYELTPVKYLSQPGQFVSSLRLTVVGPKGHYNNVVVLGPVRKETQVEISLTDNRELGTKAPIRLSGDIEGTPGITLVNGSRSVTLPKGLIVAKRHIHVKSSDASRLDVQDHDIVKVKVEGKRPLVFEDVIVRVKDNYSTYMHIDYDEANACGLQKGSRGYIVKG